MDLTGFLFGNVNEEGELEDESVLDKETVVQLSRLGVTAGIGELVEGGVVRVGADDGDSLDEYDSDGDVAKPVDKSPTAVDFADITELAEEGEGEVMEGTSAGGLEDQERSEMLFQKGMAFAQAQLSAAGFQQSGSGVGVATECDDYDMDSEDTEAASGQQFPDSEETQSMSQQTDSGYGSGSSLPLSDNRSESPGSHDTLPTPYQVAAAVSEDHITISSHQVATPTEAPPTLPSDVKPLGETSVAQDKNRSSSGKDTQKIESAIPYLIPKDMTLEQLHAKVKQLFPGFVPNSILKFCSLLGPPKISVAAKLWAGAKRPPKKPPKTEEKHKWKFNFGPPPPPDKILDRDEKSFLTSEHTKPSSAVDSHSHTGQSSVQVDPETHSWRFGPAQMWYDMIGVPDNGRGLDYGFKLKSPVDGVSEDEGVPPSLAGDNEVPDDAFLMVAQLPWENQIIWDSPYTPGPPASSIDGVWTTESAHSISRQSSSDHTSSLFPVNNPALVYSRWEDDIIWDTEAVSHVPKPIVPQLDPNDPNVILGIPVEPVTNSTTDKDGKKVGPGLVLAPPTSCPVSPLQDGRPKAKLSLLKGGGKTGSEASQSSFLGKKDLFNLSNDEFYNPRHVTSTQGLSGLDSTVVQHSLPGLDLHTLWFPTHLSLHSLRNFHRPKLRLRCDNRRGTTGFITVEGLKKHIARKNKERERERESSGGGEVFFMRTPEDVSACDGQLVLAEYSEQHPPLLMSTGMATRIKNYYRRPERQVKSHAPRLQFGETTYIQSSSYFLGQLHSGQLLQSFETNLFRAPVYHHTMPDTDLVVIISGSQVFVRDVRSVFLVGQECPKVEVPPPNSKSAMQFQKDFLLLFLYKLFRDSDDSPPRIKMEAVRKAFPPAAMSESVIRKVLKQCADFKREGYENGWWVLRSDCRLPSDEEIRSMITPEQVCAYYSTLVSEQRLKDAGYRGKSLFTVEEEEEDSTQKIDDEVRAAPWNTTHHFINAMKGKYQLSISGPADPTGCGEGFSYTRLSTRRDTGSGVTPNKRYKPVVGTDGDLRKLKLSKAKQVLRNFGVPEEEISKLSRWAVIDMVRELSTEAAKSGGVDRHNLKFARGAKFSQMEAQEKYKEKCQRVFDLQNKVLSSTEQLSTEEESSDSGGEGGSDDELARNLETLLGGRKTTRQLTHEQEELERQELRKLLDKPSVQCKMEDSGETSGRATPLDGDDTSSLKSFSSAVGTGRRLVIMRTFMSENGTEYTRTEVVKSQPVIDAYVRLMGHGGKEVRTQFADQDQQTREDMKREKRRIQDQLRRLKRQEEKATKKKQKPQKQKPLTTINMKCSACGERGHMKTNKNCPMYKNTSVTVAPTDNDLAQQEASLTQDDLIKVEGTKVVLNRALVEHATGVRKASLLLKFPKDRMKRRRRQTEEDLEYLEKRPKSVQRRKANPELRMADLLEKIINTTAAATESEAFRKPVPAKIVPDYYNVIKFPMDLQTMKENCRNHMYLTREAFWEHINLIVNNCSTYNGFKSELTRRARKMLDICAEEIKKHEKEMEQLEAEINPALDDDPQVALSYLFTKAIDAMKANSETWIFHEPVPAKSIPDYYKIIRRPMDLGTMKKNCQLGLYQSRAAFMADLNQIRENSLTYNGPRSKITHTAEEMILIGVKALDEEAELIVRLESKLGDDRGSSLGPTPSPAASSSTHDTSTDYYVSSQSQGNDPVRGVASEYEEVDVERWEEGGVGEEGRGGVDLLLEDLQASSNSEDESSEDGD